MIKATPLQVNGILYFTLPDHVWAIDARTGREIWHHTWTSTGGIHIGNRGVGILGDSLYFETPDCHLVSLNVKDGTERWRQRICDLDQFYYASVAPIIVKNHVIVGVSGDDLDVPGYLEARDPQTGALQWRWYAVPQKMGDPGSDTWPNEDAMKHGGGMTWQPVTYDPELNLVFVTTGNPQPVIAHANRAGDNLFTAADRRARRRHRKDGVVLPVVAARHARLGLDADGGALRRRDRRAAAQARGAGGAQRPLLRPRSRHRQGDRVVGVREDRTGRAATTRRASRFPTRRRCRRPTARW